MYIDPHYLDGACLEPTKRIPPHHRSSHFCAIPPQLAQSTKYQIQQPTSASSARCSRFPTPTGSGPRPSSIATYTTRRIEQRCNRNATSDPPLCKPVPAPLCMAISSPTNVPRQKAKSTSGEMRSTHQHEQVLLPFFFLAELGLLLLEDAERCSLFWWYSGMSALGAMALMDDQSNPRTMKREKPLKGGGPAAHACLKAPDAEAQDKSI